MKVNIDYKGSLSTASMPGLAEWRPASTALCCQKLVDAGAIVYGLGILSPVLSLPPSRETNVI